MKRRTYIGITLALAITLAVSGGCAKKKSNKIEETCKPYVQEENTTKVTQTNTKAVTTKVVTEKVTNAAGEIETVTKAVTEVVTNTAGEKVTNAAGEVETVTNIITEEVTTKVVIASTEGEKTTVKYTEKEASTLPTTAAIAQNNNNKTQATSQKETEKATEAQTTAPTEKETEKPTEKEVVTQQPQTQAATVAPTQASTQAQLYEVWVYDNDMESTAAGVERTFKGDINKIMRDYPTTGKTFRTLVYDGGFKYVDVEYNENTGLTLAEARQAILEGFNYRRAQNGWPPVVMTFGNKDYNPNLAFNGQTQNLTENAQIWADYMANNNFFYHSGLQTILYGEPSVCDEYVNEAIGKDEYFPFFDYYNCWSMGASLAIHNQRYMDDYCKENGYELLTEIGIGVATNNGVVYYCIQATN